MRRASVKAQAAVGRQRTESLGKNESCKTGARKPVLRLRTADIHQFLGAH